MWSFFTDGIKHITDPGGYDHVLFLASLCAPFSASQWKHILLLATAFTVGHSISLALAAFDVIRFSSELIELLIPITILCTSLFNLLLVKKNRDQVAISNYYIVAGFGVIHGMGFSSYFRMITEKTTSMLEGLLAFNLGVELGQVFIIAAFLLLRTLLRLAISNDRAIVIIISFFTGIVASYLILIKLVT